MGALILIYVFIANFSLVIKICLVLSQSRSEEITESTITMVQNRCMYIVQYHVHTKIEVPVQVCMTCTLFNTGVPE